MAGRASCGRRRACCGRRSPTSLASPVAPLVLMTPTVHLEMRMMALLTLPRLACGRQALPRLGGRAAAVDVGVALLLLRLGWTRRSA